MLLLHLLIFVVRVEPSSVVMQLTKMPGAASLKHAARVSDPRVQPESEAPRNRHARALVQPFDSNSLNVSEWVVS